MKNITILFLFLLCLTGLISAGVKSPSDQLIFDVNNDGVGEMALIGGHLGIGTLAPSSNLQVMGNAIFTEKLVIGGGTGHSNLHIHGSLGYSFSTYNSSGNIGENSYILVDTSSDNILLKLPYAGNTIGRILTIKQTSLNNELILVNSGNYIENFATMTASATPGQLPSISLMSDGRDWSIIRDFGSFSELNSDNTVVWWRLDETSGSTASDFSENNYTGTLSNAHLFSGNSTTGTIGNALIMDSIDDSVSNTSVPTTYSEYAYSFWFNPNVSSDTPVHFGGNIDGVLGFSWASTNTIWNKACYHQLNDNSYIQAQLISTLSANVWHHIAATWDGSNLRAYFNGQLEATTSAPTLKTPSGNMEITIPQTQCIAPYFIIDDFRFFNQSLSDDKIISLYQTGHP